jgi:hypothetical protein
MSLRRIVLGLLVIWLGVMGIACGLLCLICLILYVLWQGLGISSIVLALLCLFCLGLAVMLSGRAAAATGKPGGFSAAWLRSLKDWRQSPAGNSGVQPGLREANDWEQEFSRYRESSLKSQDGQRATAANHRIV